MENKFLWEEQLEKFKKAYLADGINEQFKDFISTRDHVDTFIPIEAGELFTDKNNIQYNLNGRSLLGIIRKWIYKCSRAYEITLKHGVSINPGLIQLDHSGFLYSGKMSDIFIEVKSKNEMIDTVSRLLNLSNEQMAREFNIKSNQSDISTLFNAVILDPIIDSELQKNNFGGYSHCWNDSNLISLSLKNSDKQYRISRQNVGENDFMELTFPNGERIKFIQKFKDGNKRHEYEYTIDDVTTEILEINGDSPLLQTVVAQIERFSERELKKQEETQKPNGDDKIEMQDLDEDSQNTNYDDSVAHSKELSNDFEYDSSYEEYLKSTMLDRQIIAKKIQMALSNQHNNIQNGQVTIDWDEFYIVREMFNEIDITAPEVFLGNIGRTHSANYERYPYSKGEFVYNQEYLQIKLSNGNVLSIEFLGKENNGRITVKSEDERIHNSCAESDLKFKGEGVSTESVLAELGNYLVDDVSLVQLLEQKLLQLEKDSEKYSKLESLIKKQYAKEGQNIGE